MRARQSAASAHRRQPAHAHQANRSWASRITPQGRESHPSLKNHLRSKLRTRGCKVSRALEPVLVKMNLRAQGRPTPSTQSPNALPRPLPAAFVTLAPVADRAALILEPAPFAPRMRQRGLVAPIEQKNDEIECAVGLAGFGAREPDQHRRGVGIAGLAGQEDRLGHRIAVPGRPMGKKARVVIGPQPLVESGDHLVGRGAHDDAPALLARALDEAGQRLVDAPPLEMMKARLHHWPAGPTMTKVRSEPVAISPRLTPPGSCSSVLPAT